MNCVPPIAPPTDATSASLPARGDARPPVGNVSKARRDRLLAEVAAIKSFLEKSAGADTNAVRLLSFAAELEKEVRGRKYGLVFEEHRERVDAELDANIPVLSEVKERFIAGGSSFVATETVGRDAPIAPGGSQFTATEMPTDAINCVPPHAPLTDATSASLPARGDARPPLNFLIEGDNLAALKLLEKTHRGKIDLVYIDPPYNTGNKDFIYNDSYVDKTDAFRHSKWLSFMRKRLDIAKRLMSDKGIIFISIDDNEQAALKLLCDDVFGFDNFITCFPWHSRQSLQNDTDISINHEYVVCYAKNRRQKDRRLKPSNFESWHNGSGFVFYPLAVDASKYANPDNDPRGPWKADPFDAPGIRENLQYEIENPNTGKSWFPPSGRHWRMSYDKFSAALADNRILFGKTGKSKPQLKVFLNEQEAFGSVANSWFEAEEFGTATHGSKELQTIFDGAKVFDSPKPTTLITGLMRIASLPDKPLTVLDFFAGSGTTGHAVMKLNAEDGGRRRFILVTNNENGICENVTYERLKRVIEKEKYAARLKYFKVGYVPITEDGYWERADALLGSIRELVELENGVDFAREPDVAIVLTDEELEGFVAGLGGSRLSRPGNDGRGRDKRVPPRILYKGHNVILGAKAKAAIEKRGIEVRTIPDYYYPELED